MACRLAFLEAESPRLGSDRAFVERDLPAMSSSRFKVRVTKDYLVFCSGHFITYDGDHCERIHGHNYRTAVEVEGDLDENHYVVDFIALKDLTRAITDELDHRMLLPTRSRQIQLHEEGANLRVTYRDRYWSFPRDECVLLPIANTTAELLADYIAGRLRQEMTARGWSPPRVLRVEVEESFGQSAQVEWRRDDGVRGGLSLPSHSAVEPRQLPMTDPAVVERGADQDRRGTGGSQINDLFDPGDSATDTDADAGVSLANPSQQALGAQPSPGSHPGQIEHQDMTHAVLDATCDQFPGILRRPGSRRGRQRPAVKQVEAEDDPLRTRQVHDSGQLETDRARSRGRRRSYSQQRPSSSKGATEMTSRTPDIKP